MDRGIHERAKVNSMNYRLLKMLLRSIGTHKLSKRLGHIAYKDGVVFVTDETQMVIYEDERFTAKGLFCLKPDDVRSMPEDVDLRVDEQGFVDQNGKRYGREIAEYPDLRKSWDVITAQAKLGHNLQIDARRLERLISTFKAAKALNMYISVQGSAVLMWGSTPSTRIYGALVGRVTTEG